MKRLTFLTAAVVLAAALSACEPQGGGTSSSASSESSTSETASASESSSESSSSVITHIDFPHGDPGVLMASSGSGYADRSNWAPGMCFPTAGEAYANSQVYRPGGMNGGSGGQCSTSNYSYPWQDNFCETRSAANIMCNNGQGHQGQDIRPATCASNTHWAVAAEDGVITQIGSYTVGLTGANPPYRIYRYLHMQSSTLRVAVGDSVVRGQKLGLISNNMGGTATTIHLHYEIRIAQSETVNGQTLAAYTFVPPYIALVDAYQRKLAGDCPTVE